MQTYCENRNDIMVLNRFYHGLIWIPILFGLFGSCKSGNEVDIKGQSMVLHNKSSISLKEKAIQIDRDEISVPTPEKSTLLILDGKGDTIPSQLVDRNGDGSWDKLFFLMDFNPMGRDTVHLVWSDNEVIYEARTKVRFGVRASMEDQVVPAKNDIFYPHELPGVMGYQPYQTDGPSWENDKVGFRHYLDGRNSKDVFGKKVSYMSPDSVGINKEGVTEDNYHVMEDWGRDILSVGNSVGIGGFGLKIKDHYARLGVTEADSINNVEETYFEVLESGPLKSLMKYEYRNWRPNEMERTYQVEEWTGIWPGMYAYRNEVSFKGLKGDETAFIGLVNSNTDKPLTQLEVGKYLIFFTHDKQTYDKEWYLGLALIIPKDSYLSYSESPDHGRFSDSFAIEMKINENIPISYYSVAAWELADPGFSDESYFQEYLVFLTGQLDAEVAIADITQSP